MAPHRNPPPSLPWGCHVHRPPPDGDGSDDESHTGALAEEGHSRPGGRGTGGRDEGAPARENPRPPSTPRPSEATGSAGTADDANTATSARAQDGRPSFLVYNEGGDLSPLGRWSEWDDPVGYVSRDLLTTWQEVIATNTPAENTRLDERMLTMVYKMARRARRDQLLPCIACWDEHFWEFTVDQTAREGPPYARTHWCFPCAARKEAVPVWVVVMARQGAMAGDTSVVL